MTDAIGGTLWTAGSQGLAPGVSGFRQATITAASQALGMTSQDLVAQLQQGLSMSDIAQQKGVSGDTLLSAVAGAVQPLAGSTGIDANAIAQKIVDHRGVGGHHRAGRGGTSDPDGDGDVDSTNGPDVDGSQSPFAALSSMLGMSQTDLLAAFESGSSLPDLLSQNGLTQSSLAAVLGQQTDSTTGSIVDTTA